MFYKIKKIRAMNNIIFNWKTIILTAIVCIGFTSCGSYSGDDEVITDTNVIIENLKSHKWIGSSTEYDEYSYGVGTFTQTWTLYFTSESTGVMHCRIVDKDSSLGTSRREEHIDFTYTIDGTKIRLGGDSNFVFDYYGDYMMEHEDRFNPYQMTNDDYTYISNHEKDNTTANKDNTNDIQFNGNLTVSGSLGGYSYVDLGLSVKWATYNVGSNSPENSGGYYAWGEISEKSNYSYSNYSFVKTDKVPSYFYNIGNDISQTKYDVAYKKWGSSWRMPTRKEYDELVNNCTSQWITIKGVKGRIYISKNGNTIFFPAVGYKEDNMLKYYGDDGYYWTSNIGSVSSDVSNHYPSALIANFDSEYGDGLQDRGYRADGLPVRAVSDY